MNRTLITGIATTGAVLLAACGSNSTSTSTGAAGRPSSMSSTTPSSTQAMGMTGTASATAAPTTGGSPTSGPHNTADVSFATHMIPHHAQAVTMADMALSSATTAGVKKLAADIKAAQSPEIAEMSGWLAGWNKPVPSSSYNIGGSMGGMSVRGMMSDEDMTALSHVHGASFDRMWLTMMISHHLGAIAMATTELATGQNSDSKKLARSIIASQRAQIAQMKKMLANLSG